MADSKLDLTIPFATFMATNEGDGTWADIIQVTKQDKPGNLVDATGIKDSGGQLVANIWDDMWVQSYRIFQGAKLHSTDTANATPVDIGTIDTLTVNGDAAYIRATVTARDGSAPGNLVEVQLGGTFYRSGGTVSVMNPISTVSRVGFTTATAELFRAGDVISARVTGEAGTDIEWSFTVNESRRLR